MLSRRRLLSAAPVVAGSAFAAPATATPPADDPGFAIPTDWQFQGPDSPVDATVSETKRGREIARSVDVLRDIPAKAGSFQIARYFEGINIYNEDCRSYAEEWQSNKQGPSNPIVIMFHTITNTQPNKEDHTAWCAAFVSFCLLAGREKSLWTCWALDYRNYGADALNDPRPGDIAVFRNKTGGGGHVGFFVAWDLDRNGKKVGVRCLGGNQGDRIKTSSYPFTYMPLVAIRRPQKAPVRIEKKVCAHG